MFEKVNPSHPDKIADRIAGAIVDLCYTKNENPKVAVEVLIGHGCCHIIVETSEDIRKEEVAPIVKRIGGDGISMLDLDVVPQDAHLSANQGNGFRCGDNGIFKGVPVTQEQQKLSDIARRIYMEFPTDGKYILNGERLIVCQSNAIESELKKICEEAEINPLGSWTGGTDVDTGATNRKLGSDMGDGVTGGGLHGKDLSKADVSVNIFAHLQAQRMNKEVKLCCAIGDRSVDGIPFSDIVSAAKEYIKSIGGFEKFAEWGLI